MSVGPLRRIAGALGLVGLVPTAVLLITGGITAGDAAVRALITFVVVRVVCRLAGWLVAGMADDVERAATDEPEAGLQPEAGPRRRRSDQVVAAAE